MGWRKRLPAICRGACTDVQCGFRMHPLSPSAAKSALIWCGGLVAAALFAGAVRILPWVLDPSVPMRVALPFARGVGELAIEAAILIGWPLGWALAAHKFAERGEARAMMLLGESPIRATLLQWRSGVPLAIVLAIASAMGARDASAPGIMAGELIAQGRAACARATTASADPRSGTPQSARTYAIPFVDATWLCRPGEEPVLYGSGPGSLHSVAFTAKDARVAGDMRRFELDDARFSMESLNAHVHAEHVVLHGMSPWTHASNVPPLERSIVIVLTAALAALVATFASLTRLAHGPLAAVGVAVAGPLAALGVMRAFERADVPASVYFVTPIVAAGASLAIGFFSRALRASKTGKRPIWATSDRASYSSSD